MTDIQTIHKLGHSGNERNKDRIKTVIVKMCRYLWRQNFSKKMHIYSIIALDKYVDLYDAEGYDGGEEDRDEPYSSNSVVEVQHLKDLTDSIISYYRTNQYSILNTNCQN